MAGIETALGAARDHPLAAGDTAAVFRPAQGMLCASLTHRGTEFLRRVDDLDAAAVAGGTVGIPLLHPWANRLPGWNYRAAGRDVVLDPASPLLHRDATGLPIHGVPWSRLPWSVLAARGDALVAALDWSREEWLAVFPFRHRLELAATVEPGALLLRTTLTAGAGNPVPASFGFHPYVGLPGLPRGAWRVQMPAMRRLALDRRAIPTGVEEPCAAFDAPLGDRDFDDGFALDGEDATFTVSGAGCRIAVEFLEGFTHAQVYAPRDGDFIALEPMTAPTGALASGRGLRVVAPGAALRTAFRLRIVSP